ncbi:hypothetical protein CWI42_021530 [Ordospora colligata]|uniref:Uncharacterized protein n=1 Tax=Ordospora colligata OC4 TaxID=1354746 RepID=A0A0B2UMZ5_9MICR|nr:uncharacterized protein M896_021540 [Ordospora colligata OC4]KHN70315.1 hypothetical protein M896_021540 [Ordospora colligata OC4]TBU16859.1 hypothetical protein CWI41_021550 [Ordospora colligata]TBU16967.1 hypothetical protein CWI40_021550 [Ordospora colligata]TBU19408.1 hypothetical protein CWI42_021530 [Ordospora colligata]
MSTSIQERKTKLLKRLEFTLGITSSTLLDINSVLKRITEANSHLEKVADTYSIWSAKISSFQ